MNDSLVVHTAPQRPVTLLAMSDLSLNDALDAAAYALVGERCRHAHLHDIRGELQTLQSSLELLARSARNPTEKIALAEKATALARRALANHEKALLEFVNQITPHAEATAAVDVREMVNGALRFLRNEAANKSITFNVEAAADLRIVAHPYRSRLLILGLFAMTIDELRHGAAVTVTLGRADSHVLIEIQSDVVWPAVRSPEDLWSSATSEVPLRELLLAVTSRWASANGGRVELPQETQSRPALRLYYPGSVS
jgi:signal transduction histidine kinase